MTRPPLTRPLDYSPASDDGAELTRLREENRRLKAREQAAFAYIRDKVDQLLQVMGTLPLEPEELDNETLLGLDPIGIVSSSFAQVLEHLRATNSRLNQAQEEIEAIFQSAGTGILVVDDQMRLRAYNQKSRELFFPERDAVLGADLRSVICNGGNPAENALFDRVMATRAMVQQTHFSYRNRHFHVVGTPIKDEAGSVHSVVLVYTDITEREQTEAALRDSERRYRDLFENANDLIQSVAVDGTILYVNRAWRETLGYRENEIARLSIFDIIHPDCREHCRGEFMRLMEGQPALRMETRFLTREGKTIWVEGNVNCSIQNSHTVSTRGVFRDITERKKFEAALQESEYRHKILSGRFQTLFDGIPDPLLLLDRELNIVWANGAATSLAKNPLTRLIGNTCFGLMHGTAEPCAECPVETCFSTAKRSETRFSSEDGRTWEVRTFPILTDAGKPQQVVKLMHDVTETLRLQQETLRAGQLAALGELAAGVAHEINNPINGIINYAQILANRAAKTGQNDEIAQRIIHEGDRIARIVGSLLSFARVRNEERHPVALLEILQNVLALIETQLNRDGITCSLELPPDLPLVRVRGQQIEQVLLNILSNARYALNEKHPHSDPAKRIDMAAAEINGMVRMTVTDYGSGIPPEALKKVLNPFYSTKPAGKGTGLGLSISQGILNEHGGALLIDSRVGEWTRVTLDIPTH